MSRFDRICSGVLLLAIAAMVILMLVGCTPEQVAAVRAELDRREQVRMHPFLTCVRRHESDPVWPYVGGYYRGNTHGDSTSSGAYQFVNGTWRSMSSAAGFAGYPRAMDAPDWVQDAVAVWTLENVGRSPWAGTGC